MDYRCEALNGGERCSSTLTVRVAGMWICNVHYERIKDGMMAWLAKGVREPAGREGEG